MKSPAIGVLFALCAGVLWGLVFLVPLLLPQQSPALLSLGRYLAFGLVCLPLALFQWRSLQALTARDWRKAFALSVVGNFVYYGFLASAIQTLGNPLPSLMIGTLPVVIMVCANLGWAQAQSAPRVQWRRLLLPCALLLAGLSCVNAQELALLGAVSAQQYWLGLGCAFLAVAAWTWYPLVNDKHLKAHPQIAASTWATAQGLATLLPAAALFTVFAMQAQGSNAAIAAIPGQFPPLYWTLMLTLGVACSWLGTLCWNAACQRLPAAVSGQLIVFETLAALVLGYLYRGQGPSAVSLLGIGLLLGGVVWGVRVFTRQTPPSAVEA